VNRDSFLSEIAERPDDDGTRLVYADWLEDNGDPDRAEFIRVQIERARLPDEDDRQAELEACERRLLLKHADRWVPAELPVSWTRFRRGLPEVLAPEMSSWLTDEQIGSLGALPLRELWLSGGSEEVDTGRIREMEWMERVEGLRLHDRFASADARDLLGSRWLRRLRWLDLKGANLHEYDLNHVLDLPAVGAVERLVLYNDHVSARTVSRLAAMPWPNLRKLSVGTDRLTRAGVEALLDSDLWAGLEAIELWATHTTAVDVLVEVLCERSRWGGLRHLCLVSAELELSLFERLVGHPANVGLRSIALLDTLSSESHRSLADASNLTSLTGLDLGPGKAILGLLARSRYLTRLTNVRGWGSEAEVIDFVTSPNADHVRWLSPETFSDRIAGAIAGSPHMARLTTLKGMVTLSDEAAEALAASPHLKCLTRLELDTSRLSARGQQALLEAEHLGWVGIPENQLKNSHLRRLWQKRYGDGERVRVISSGWPEWP
jgi:uncharacterized protein (TIGR02996 family)